MKTKQKIRTLSVVADLAIAFTFCTVSCAAAVGITNLIFRLVS